VRGGQTREGEGTREKGRERVRLDRVSLISAEGVRSGGWRLSGGVVGVVM